MERLASNLKYSHFFHLPRPCKRPLKPRFRSTSLHKLQAQGSFSALRPYGCNKGRCLLSVAGRKAALVEVWEKRKKKMKVITNFELANRTDNELAALFAMASKALVMTDRETPERRNIIASLENINRARAGRYYQARQPGF